jgi:hypothetical protein
MDFRPGRLRLARLLTWQRVLLKAIVGLGMPFMGLFYFIGRRRGWGREPARRARSRLRLDSPREAPETGVRELARRTAPGCPKTSCSNSAHLPPVSEASRGVHANRRRPTPPPAPDIVEWPRGFLRRKGRSGRDPVWVDAALLHRAAAEPCLGRDFNVMRISCRYVPSRRRQKRLCVLIQT